VILALTPTDFGKFNPNWLPEIPNNANNVSGAAKLVSKKENNVTLVWMIFTFSTVFAIDPSLTVC